MDEIMLSNDLNQIELEINHHKNIAGQSIWEIGRRLKHVKEHNLTHGEFGKWVESIGIARTEASRFIKIVEELPNLGTYTNLGTKALYLIATLPDEKKQEELSKAEAGDPSTVRELRELKKQLKQEQEQNIDLTNEVTRLSQRTQSKPKVVTKEVVKEVKPADYDALKSDNQQLSQSHKKQQAQIQKLEEDLNLARTKYQLLENTSKEAKELEAQINQMRQRKDSIADVVNNTFELNDRLNRINHFFEKEMAAMRFKPILEHVESQEMIQKLRNTVDTLIFWTEEMQRIIPRDGMQIIEGEIIDDK